VVAQGGEFGWECGGKEDGDYYITKALGKFGLDLGV